MKPIRGHFSGSRRASKAARAVSGDVDPVRRRNRGTTRNEPIARKGKRLEHSRSVKFSPAAVRFEHAARVLEAVRDFVGAQERERDDERNEVVADPKQQERPKDLLARQA
jgi:hypothetical protein